VGADEKKPDAEAASDQPADPNVRHATSEANQAKARKWFARAKELVETRSYDYAIKCYIDGLTLCPEAVEEGHQPLRGCAAARHHGGGKKPSFTDTVKHSMNQKDPIKGMLNAEWLLAHDPMNVNYMEGLFKNADKARCDDTVMWIGHALGNAAEQEKKPSPKRFALLKEVYEELGDRAQARGEAEMAEEAYRRGISAMNVQERLDPKDTSISNIRRDLSTKLTILKGKYQTAESFQESIRDREGQADIHDLERMVQSSGRLAELVAKAEREVEEHPGDWSKVGALVDLLCREDDKDNEAKAIAVLVGLYGQNKNYQYKSRADDIRMRQLQRAYRQAKAGGDEGAAREARIKQLRFELKVFKERTAKYPTDNRLKYEYGVRLFKARKLDEAIPILQVARADAKHRTQCDVFLGRCFYEKGYHHQAVSTLGKALDQHELPSSDEGKALRYWLARSHEAEGARDPALEQFGRLLEIDYNYRDVRARMDALRAEES
jgi:tetratricopeptide (TPR) repeat protein